MNELEIFSNLMLALQLAQRNQLIENLSMTGGFKPFNRIELDALEAETKKNRNNLKEYVENLIKNKQSLSDQLFQYMG